MLGEGGIGVSGNLSTERGLGGGVDLTWPAGRDAGIERLTGGHLALPPLQTAGADLRPMGDLNH